MWEQHPLPSIHKHIVFESHDDHHMKGKTMVGIQLSFSASNCIDDQIKNEERNEEKKFYSHHKVYIENWLFEESNSLL